MSSDLNIASLPGPHQVRAAARLASALLGTTSGHARREMYRRLPTGGMFGAGDLAAGEALLVQLDLLEAGSSADELVATPGLTVVAALPHDTAASLIVRTILSMTARPWAAAAVAGEALDYAAVPETARRLLEGLDADEREAALLAAGRRVDPQARADAGQKGEILVVAAARADLTAAGRPDLAQQVQRVSLVSDQLGYDVTAPTVNGGVRRLEVKMTGAARRVHLSRTEADVGLRDPSWALVVCSFSQDTREPMLSGWCRGHDLLSMLPTDVHPRGRWADVMLALPPDLLRPGLPT